eukprot:2328580-Amphidinium_carterae.1
MADGLEWAYQRNMTAFGWRLARTSLKGTRIELGIVDMDCTCQSPRDMQLRAPEDCKGLILSIRFSMVVTP